MFLFYLNEEIPYGLLWVSLKMTLEPNCPCRNKDPVFSGSQCPTVYSHLLYRHLCNSEWWHVQQQPYKLTLWGSSSLVQCTSCTGSWIQNSSDLSMCSTVVYNCIGLHGDCQFIHPPQYAPITKRCGCSAQLCSFACPWTLSTTVQFLHQAWCSLTADSPTSLWLIAQQEDNNMENAWCFQGFRQNLCIKYLQYTRNTHPLYPPTVWASFSTLPLRFQFSTGLCSALA